TKRRSSAPGSSMGWTTIWGRAAVVQERQPPEFVLRLLLLEHWAEILLWDVDLNPGTLLLQGERDAKIALGPAALHGTRQLIERELPELHRHADFTRQLERQRRVLVRKPQREVRGVVFSWQEILGQAVEGPF